MNTRVFLIILFFLTQSFISVSWATPNLDLQDPSYRKIDQLIAHRLLKVYIYGQRPWSRREIAYMVIEARRNIEKIQKGRWEKEAKFQNRKDRLDKILIFLEKEFQQDISALQKKSKVWEFKALDKMTLRMGHLQSDTRLDKISIDSKISPLTEHRGGRDYSKGLNSSFETTHSLQFRPYLSLFAQPRFQGQVSTNAIQGSDENEFYFQKLYLKLLLKNFEILVGRDELLWGQGDQHALALSTNARPLDMIKISNDRPFFFPWIFKYLGAAKLSFFYSDLGPDQVFPHPYLVGYKFTLKPAHFIELGAYHFTLGGGEGSPGATLGQRIRDTLPIEHVFNLGSVQQPISNKIGGLDFRLTLPPLRNTQLYFEMAYDDIHNITTKTFLVDDAAYHVGLYIPRLDNLGRLSLRLEYEYTGKRFFTHGQFRDGWTVNRQLIGSALGPKGKRVALNLSFELNERLHFDWKNAFYIFSNDAWGFTEIPDGPDIFVKGADYPEEYRFLTSLKMQYQHSPAVRLDLEAAYERVQRYQFNVGDNRNHFLLEMAIHIDFGRL